MIEQSKVLKSGVWYTASNFLLKGIGFITTPIFTRLLTTTQYGEYSNFSTWYNIITIIITLSLYASLIRARHDFKDDLDGYVKTILILGTVATLVFDVLIFGFLSIVLPLVEIKAEHLILMLASLLVSPAVTIYTTLQQYSYKYKTYAIISVSIAVLEICTSLALVVFLQDKVLGRVVGTLLPLTVISIIIYIRLLTKSGAPKIKYVKYAVGFCLPYIVHLLSNTLLAQSDRVMIYQICGAEANAMYSLAYSLSQIVSLLWSSMNNAVSPMIGDCLHEKNFELSRKITAPYVFVFIVPVMLAVLLAPEMIWFFGGDKYKEAIYYIPPIFLGCILQFFYSMYVNIEQYEKKTGMMALGTFLAAALNVILNAIFIPIYGQTAAAYTTVAGYAFLLTLHYLVVRKMKLTGVYNGKIICLALSVSAVGTALSLSLYGLPWLRISIIGVLFIGVCWFAWKYKAKITQLIKNIIR